MMRTHLGILLAGFLGIFSGPLFAKGPFIYGLYRGGSRPEAPEMKFEIRFGLYNIPGTTARIRSCNFHYGCTRPDALSAFNPVSKVVESYLREIVFTRLDYQNDRSWEIEYAYIESDGRVAPMAVVTIPENTSGVMAPATITIKTKYPTLEFSMDRISD